jgi:hypothetical protein
MYDLAIELGLRPPFASLIIMKLRWMWLSFGMDGDSYSLFGKDRGRELEKDFNPVA